MIDQRKKDVLWYVCWADRDGGEVSWDGRQLAVLMDIRDELKRLNTLLHCSNFTAIPGELRAIRRNTTKPRRKKAQRAR